MAKQGCRTDDQHPGPRPRGGVRGGDSPLKGGVRGLFDSIKYLHALRPEASADIYIYIYISVSLSIYRCTHL